MKVTTLLCRSRASRRVRHPSNQRELAVSSPLMLGRAFGSSFTLLVYLLLPTPLLACGASAMPMARQSQKPTWQNAAGGKMEFEVAAIHPAAPGPFIPPSFELSIDNGSIPPGGRFFACFPLEDFIEFAYKIFPTPQQREAMLAKLPKWAKTQYFVIDAKAPGNPTKDQMRLMLQALLAERFHLSVHFETRLEPALALVLIHRGHLGPRIESHSQGLPCYAKWTPPVDSSAAYVPPGGFVPKCGSVEALDGPTLTVLGGARDATMEEIADYLPNIEDFGRPVVDRTGLTGGFDFTIEYTPARKRPAEDADSATMDAMTSLIEALKKQWGMKLEPTKAPIQILVIDHVDPPSPN